MNILDEREVRKIHRKLKKKEYDEVITLSAEEGTKVRLLDEGMVVRADGSPWFYIMKGTLQKFYDELSDEYEGSINLGHMSFATFPILLGSWSKRDLTLVDTGSGRMGLDVNVRLDEENVLVKELRRANYELSISAELTSSIDEEATEKYGIPMVNSLTIWDFAIVGEPGNVNSWVQLKGEDMKFEDIKALLNGAEDLTAINDALDKALEEPEETAEDLSAEENTEEAAEETAEEAEEEASEELSAEEETEEETEEVTLASVMEAIKALNTRIESLEAEKAELQAELSAKKQAEADFVEKFKKLSVSLATERKEEPVVEYEASFTDGFGG